MTTVFSMILICCLPLLIFCAHLIFTSHKNQTANTFLSIALLTRVLQVVVFYSVYNNHLTVFPYLYKIFVPLFFVLPAFLYLYVKGITNQSGLTFSKIWWHLVPYFILLIHFSPFWDIEPVNWLALAQDVANNKQMFIVTHSGLFNSDFLAFFRFCLVIGYLIACWTLIKKLGFFSFSKISDLQVWVLFCVSLCTIGNLVGFLPYLTHHLESPVLDFPWFIVFNVLIMIGLIGYVAHRPNLLYTYLLIRVKSKQEIVLQTLEEPQDKTSIIIEDKTTNVIQKVILNEIEIEAHKKLIEEVMEKENPFLDPDFRIINLATLVDIPMHHCSYIINHVINKNFREWVNCYRILYFKNQYPYKAHKMTIEALALESGFKNMSTFYTAFKKETGVLPKVFFAEKLMSNMD